MDQVFVSENKLSLVVEKKKRSVVLRLPENNKSIDYWFDYRFDNETFISLIDYIKKLAHLVWPNLQPKEADTAASDYDEYYDKEYDCNTYLTVSENYILIDRGSLEMKKLYEFNKRRMESFLFDANKIIKNQGEA